MCSTIEHDERADLPMLESVLLWSMRAWTIGLSRGIPVEERIEELFAKIGAPEAAGQLYGSGVSRMRRRRAAIRSRFIDRQYAWESDNGG